MNIFIFYPLNLNKILTLTNVNRFPFASLNRIFALTLQIEPNSNDYGIETIPFRDTDIRTDTNGRQAVYR